MPEFGKEIAAAKELRRIARMSVEHVQKILERLGKRGALYRDEALIAYYRNLLSTYKVVYEEADLIVRRLETERKRGVARSRELMRNHDVRLFIR
jgi:hypothetical protein